MFKSKFKVKGRVWCVIKINNIIKQTILGHVKMSAAVCWHFTVDVHDG